jgi:hypothetical protein
MPAHLDLFSFCEQAQEFCFVAIHEPWLFGGDFFGGIRCAHSQDGIFAPETFEKFVEALRPF